MSYVELTVYCGRCKEVVATYRDKIEEKYPFWCDGCEDDLRTDKYPWAILTDVIEDNAARPDSNVTSNTNPGT